MQLTSRMIALVVLCMTEHAMGFSNPAANILFLSRGTQLPASGLANLSPLSCRPSCSHSERTGTRSKIVSLQSSESAETGEVQAPMVDNGAAGQEIERLSRRGKDFLSGSSWILKLDIGREPGTWMDARWGLSGQRVKAAVAVTLEPGGRVRVLEDYQYGLQRRLPDAVGIGWTVTGKFPQERLKIVLEHSGIDSIATGCDIDLPAGKLFFSITTLGKALSQKGGGLSIEQYRFFIRRERRLVGIFKANSIPAKSPVPSS